MMYQDRLAIAVKTNGKVLRERGDTVFIPFGSESTLFIKNMNSVRALVSIEIDGTEATEGTRLIVPANGSIELERFIKGGNLDKGHRFKFIERSEKIENGPRGIKAEDGLIRVEFEFEREPAKIYDPAYTWYAPKVEHHHHYHRDLSNVRLGGPLRGSTTVPDSAYYSANAATDDSFGSASLTSASFSSTAFSNSISSNAASAPKKGVLRASSAAVRSAPEVNDKGITVGGSVSDQKFTRGSWFATDGVKHVMILKILGETESGVVQAPVTVKTKTECPTCGTKNKFGTKFCRECGTGLQQL